MMKKVMKLIMAIFIIASFGCKQQEKEHPHEETATVEKPVKPECEVEMKSQQLQNKLLVSVENMTTTIDKLHEVLEKHIHSDITEHSQEVEKFTLDLMKLTTYLPTNNFEKVNQNAKEVLTISTQYAWENNYYKFEANSKTFNELENAINDLKSNVKSINDLPNKICETEKDIARKDIFMHLYVMGIYIGQIDKATAKGCLKCVIDYCEKLENLVKSFRETITNIDSNDFTTFNRTLADTEHTVHEMKEQAEAGDKEALHHAHESIQRHMKRLKVEVDEMN